MGKVAAGFFSLTEVTDPTGHRRYNEWHQLDHLPEQLPLDGVVFGQRWVCTPACRSARMACDASLAPIHYLTLYLMAEPLDRTLSEFAALAGRMHEEDRFYEHRRAHLSGAFDLVETFAAPRVHISAEAVPYRPNRGIYVIVERPARGDPPATPLTTVAGIAGVWTFAARAAAEPDGRPGGPRITVCFLDGEPVEVAEALDPVVTARLGPDPSAVAYAGPLETITPWQWDWFEQGSADPAH